MREEIENPTFEQIEETLAKINWSIRSHGHEHYYFYDHKNECTGIQLIFPKTDSRIEYRVESTDSSAVIVMYMKQLKMGIIDKKTVCFSGITNDSLFILMPNYTL